MFSQFLDLRHYILAAQSYSLPIAPLKQNKTKQNLEKYTKIPKQTNTNILLRCICPALSFSIVILFPKGLRAPPLSYNIFYILTWAY